MRHFIVIREGLSKRFFSTVPMEEALRRLRGSTMIVANHGVVAAEIWERAKQFDMRLIQVSPIAGQAQSSKFPVSFKASLRDTDAGWSELENVLSQVKNISPQGSFRFLDPGYGPHAEHYLLPQLCESLSIIPVCPPSEALRICSDKETAKKIFEEAGITPIPSHPISLKETPDSLRSAVARLGNRIMVKKRRSGGGMGIRLATDYQSLCEILAQFKNEGEPTPLLEKFLVKPRHLEEQIILGPDGSVSLKDRDCSGQTRNNAKIIEEAPADILIEERKIINDNGHRIAELLRKKFNYVGPITIEFLKQLAEIFGLEMNCRLQVEHGPTELTSGVDIIILRWLLAASAKLGDSLDLFLKKKGEDGKKFPILQSKADRLRELSPYKHAAQFRLNGVRMRNGHQESVSGLILKSPKSESDSAGRTTVGYEEGDIFSSHLVTPFVAAPIGTGDTPIEAYANAYRKFMAAASAFQVCFNVRSLKEFKEFQENGIPLQIGPLPTNAFYLAQVLCHEDFRLLSEETPLPDYLVAYNKTTSPAIFRPTPTTQTTADVDRGVKMEAEKASKEIQRLEKELYLAEQKMEKDFENAQKKFQEAQEKIEQEEKALDPYRSRREEAWRRAEIEKERYSFFEANPDMRKKLLLNAPDEERTYWMQS